VADSALAAALLLVRNINKLREELLWEREFDRFFGAWCVPPCQQLAEQDEVNQYIGDKLQVNRKSSGDKQLTCAISDGFINQ
jgi:hypothetical protein